MFLARYWLHIAVALALFAAGFGLADLLGDARTAKVQAAWSAEREAMLEAYVSDVQAAREREHRMAEELAEVSSQYEGRIHEIQSENDARVGELVAGTKRLRREIAAYATERLSRDSASAGELSEAARDGAELVSAAIGAGAACDAQVIALQQAYEALRRPAP